MIKEQFRNFREEKGLTQNEVAEWLNISPQSVSKWERGEALPSIEYLPKIAKLFDCSIGDLFCEETELPLSNNIDLHTRHKFYVILEKVYLEEEDNKVLQDYVREHVEIFDNMKKIVKYISTQKSISISNLQRKFNIGYARAGSIIDCLENLKIISQFRSGVYEREIFQKDLSKFIKFLEELI